MLGNIDDTIAETIEQVDNVSNVLSQPQFASNESASNEQPNMSQ